MTTYFHAMMPLIRSSIMTVVMDALMHQYSLCPNTKACVNKRSDNWCHLVHDGLSAWHQCGRFTNTTTGKMNEQDRKHTKCFPPVRTKHL